MVLRFPENYPQLSLDSTKSPWFCFGKSAKLVIRGYNTVVSHIVIEEN